MKRAIKSASMKNLESIASDLTLLWPIPDPEIEKVITYMYNISFKYFLVIENEKIPSLIERLRCLSEGKVRTFYDVYCERYKSEFIRAYPQEWQGLAGDTCDSEIKRRGDDMLIALLAHAKIQNVCKRGVVVHLIDSFEAYIDGSRLSTAISALVLESHSRG